jgi:hypothetical protein
MAHKRVSLIGSDELFRPTRVIQPVSPPTAGATPASARSTAGAEPAIAADPGPERTPESSAPAVHVRLTREEIELLLDAVQKSKHPEKVRPTHKPTMGQYEALESLRQKLLNAIPHQG